MKIILASASPRRTQLLSQIGIEHTVIPSMCEEIINKSLPEEVVMELSAQKAEDIYWKYKSEHQNQDFLVLGADTIVALENQILGKPKDETDAFHMIRILQGKKHQVYTGVTILGWKNEKEIRKTFCECSQVDVYPMTTKEINDYIATGEPLDKAGAYGIQGRFAAYTRGIEGDYNNIVGLPIARVYQELNHIL